MKMKLSIGRVVHYVISEGDSAAIRKVLPIVIAPGEHVPAIVTEADPEGDPNGTSLTCFLRGGPTYPVICIREGLNPGMWHWPEREGE